MLDAAGVVLIGLVHYKSMKCDVLFSQGSVRTIFRRGGHFSYMSKIISSSLQQCKNYKNRSRFPKVMITNVLPPFFMVHSVNQLLTYLLTYCTSLYSLFHLINVTYLLLSTLLDWNLRTTVDITVLCCVQVYIASFKESK